LERLIEPSLKLQFGFPMIIFGATLSTPLRGGNNGPTVSLIWGMQQSNEIEENFPVPLFPGLRRGAS
jgi:hypothetical protein